MLLYVKRVGVVAVGSALDDVIQDAYPPDTVSPKEPIEYQRKVRWITDIRHAPLHYGRVKELRGQYPLSAVATLDKGRAGIMAAIRLLAK